MFQAYSWTYVSAPTPTDPDEIQAWCLTPTSEPVLVRIVGVPVTCYLEFTSDEVNSRAKILALVQGLKSGLAPGRKGEKDYEASDVIVTRIEYCPKVTYLYESRLGSALRVDLLNHEAVKKVSKLSSWGGLFVRGRSDKVPFKLWEADIHPVTKYLASRGCQFCQWFKGSTEEVDEGDKISNQKEVWMDGASLTPISESDTSSLMTQPRLFSFDIECYSSNERRFPAKENAEDVITMISCLCMRQGDWDSLIKYQLVLGECDPIEGVDVRVFPTEVDLLKGFTDLIAACNPEVLVGYNTQGFDVPYIDTRLKRKLQGWGLTSRIAGQEPTVRVRQAFSEAYGYQTYYLMENMAGRVHFDLLNIIKREHKLRSYKLEYVSQTFLKKGKHDVSAKEMFRAYAAMVAAKTDEERKVARAATTRVAAYCVQDAMLVLEMFHTLNVWIAALEMCNVVHSQPEDLYTRGQQVKSKAQLYEASLKAGYIMDYRSDGYPYKGAFVQDPVQGLHDNLAVVDFASLYPSIIMAYNICYTTFDSGQRYADEDCTVLDFDESFDLKGDAAKAYLLSEKTSDSNSGDSDSDEEEAPPKRQKAVKATRKVHYHFKFLKKEKREGLLPQLVRALVAKRNQVKKQLKAYKEGDVMYNILDKRQYALKVSANSIYGFLGVQNNALLPLIQGAISVTYLGRTLISRVNSFLEDKGYKAVYNDTDSAFIDAHLSDPKEVYKVGREMAEEITALFPPPVRIEFEKPIRMLALKKKKYAYYLINEDGSIKKGDDGFPELHTKGVVSARRDNCKWQVDTFNAVLICVMDKKPLYEAADVIFSAIERLMYGHVPIEDLAVNKSMGANYKSTTAAMKVFGDELKESGNPVEPGERVDMVVVNTNDANANLGKKYRLLELYREAQSYGTAERLDIEYYIANMLQNCVDQVIEVGYNHLWTNGCTLGYKHKRRTLAPVSRPIGFGLNAAAEGLPWSYIRKIYMDMVMTYY
jgi:DNA polymerase delta subunit 1